MERNPGLNFYDFDSGFRDVRFLRLFRFRLFFKNGFDPSIFHTPSAISASTSLRTAASLTH
uniref:Uncharacterized protein n=1 Tax=Leptospira ellisii TaxID=2023197 RepID=A0A2N0B4A8_9LEPT|nr:hypothetical protein CH379_18995 [Leptospira ellisii]